MMQTEELRPSLSSIPWPTSSISSFVRPRIKQPLVCACQSATHYIHTQQQFHNCKQATNFAVEHISGFVYTLTQDLFEYDTGERRTSVHGHLNDNQTKKLYMQV